MKNPSIFFEEQQQDAETIVASTKKQISALTIFRLIVFILLCISAYAGISHHIYWGVSFMLFIGFLLLMKQHQKANRLQAYHQTKLNICAAEKGIFYSKQNGEEHLIPEHNFAYDLDVFGAGSLFHVLNRTSNQIAEKKLAEMLLHPALTEEQILAQQQSIKELSTLPDFMLKYRTFSALSAQGNEQINQFETWLNQPQKVANKPWTIWAIWLTITATITGIIAAFIYGYFGLIIGAILINWFWVGLLLRYSNQTQTIAGKQRTRFEQFASINILVTGQNFTGEQLADIKQNYQAGNEAIDKLNKLMATFDQRLNTMLGPILNSLFLFDVYCLWHIEKWKQQHGKTLLNWIQKNAEFEAGISLASYAYKHPHYVYPTLSKQPLTFKAQDLAHPLIVSHKSVSNNFEYNQQQKVFIITGSNMSGKSTFLRTVGLSILCGMIGLPVQALSMEFSIVKILSAMRIADSLQSDTSYFYAELKRLKHIMNEIESGDIPAVLFIDEMLRGTNSGEKLEGSISIIRKLVNKNCIAFIATHDLALGKLADTFPTQVSNYAFESMIVNNEMVFDYKIKPQIAQSTNATFLLKKMKIVD